MKDDMLENFSKIMLIPLCFLLFGFAMSLCDLLGGLSETLRILNYKYLTILIYWILGAAISTTVAIACSMATSTAANIENLPKEKHALTILIWRALVIIICLFALITILNISKQLQLTYTPRGKFMFYIGIFFPGIFAWLIFFDPDDWDDDDLEGLPLSQLNVYASMVLSSFRWFIGILLIHNISLHMIIYQEPAKFFVYLFLFPLIFFIAPLELALKYGEFLPATYLGVWLVTTILIAINKKKIMKI